MVELIEESEDSYIYKVLNSNFIVDKRYELLDVGTYIFIFYLWRRINVYSGHWGLWDSCFC